MAKIYLISPPKIELKDFSVSLKKAVTTGLVPVFQLRLKDYNRKEIILISKELKKICADNNCLFILNDDYKIALEIGANGVHLGCDDGLISQARKISEENFIIGASCYDSRHLAIMAAEEGADYISFGTFFPSKTKNSKGKPTVDIIKWSAEMMDLPIVAIGGINDGNCRPLIEAGADFVAVISYIWQHPEGVEVAIKNLSLKL